MRHKEAISIHTTLAGGDIVSVVPWAPINISIHTTLAGGDFLSLSGGLYAAISIHTTLAGGDYQQYAYAVYAAAFQSTPPSRVATGQFFDRCFEMYHFNPHHPRGWRLLTHLIFANLVHLISIHTTLAGGDTGICVSVSTFGTISIHTTLAGGDFRRVKGFDDMGISIHTTLAGGDFWYMIQQREEHKISIHTTLAGGDITDAPNDSCPFRFQSTPPSRVATPYYLAGAFLYNYISIHTTLAGGDG